MLKDLAAFEVRTQETLSRVNFLEIAARAHPSARDVLLADAGSVAEWIQNRIFAQLGFQEGDTVSITLNRRNDTHGLGLQSLSFALLDPHGKAKLLPDEARSPTIDVIAPNLIRPGGVKVAAVRFPVAEGQIEELEALSSAGMFVDSENTGEVALLPKGFHLRVPHPNSVRVLMEKKDPSPDEIRAAVSQRAIYACRFLKSDRQG